MAIAAQVTVFFSMSDLTWTETYYWFSSGGDQDVAYRDVGLLVSARKMFLSIKANVAQLRLSEIQLDGEGVIQPAVLRDDPFVGPKPYSAGPGTCTNTGDPEYAQMILWRCQDNTWGLKRSIMSRGQPKTFWAYDPTRPFSPPLEGNLDTTSAPWRDALRKTGGEFDPTGVWCIKGIIKDPAINPHNPVLTVSAGAPPNNNWVIGFGEIDENYAPGQLLKIGGMRGHWDAGLNAVHVIKTASLETGQVTLNTKTANDCPIHYNGKGYGRLQRYGLFPIDTVDFVRYVVRDTGVSALSHKGRTRPRKTASRYYS